MEKVVIAVMPQIVDACVTIQAFMYAPASMPDAGALSQAAPGSTLLNEAGSILRYLLIFCRGLN